MINFSERTTDTEIMDDFQGKASELKIILEDITRVNKILGGNAITVNAVFKLLKEVPKKSYIIYDVGCADGNMLRTLALKARKENYSIQFVGVDLNEDALALAREASINFPEISYVAKDVLHTDFSSYACDLVLATLTLHHFNNETIINFIRQFTKVATIGVVINDLQRSPAAYYLFHLFSAIFIRTNIAKIDGLISIRRSFVKKELQSFALLFPDIHHQIKWKWAFRYAWIMRKNI